MGRLTSKLTQSAYRVSNTTNKYNDRVYSVSGPAIPCMFRESATKGLNANREVIKLDALLWFDADHTPVIGEVYLLETEYLQIETVLPARDRLRTNTIQFYKCGVSKQRQVS